MSILDWLEEVLLSGERCESKHQHLLEDEGRTVHVLARHLMDDYWWVSVLRPGASITDDGTSGTGPEAALAIARIKGSGRRLPYTGHDSARFN